MFCILLLATTLTLTVSMGLCKILGAALVFLRCANVSECVFQLVRIQILFVTFTILILSHCFGTHSFIRRAQAKASEQFMYAQ